MSLKVTVVAISANLRNHDFSSVQLKNDHNFVMNHASTLQLIGFIRLRHFIWLLPAHGTYSFGIIGSLSN